MSGTIKRREFITLASGSGLAGCGAGAAGRADAALALIFCPNDPQKGPVPERPAKGTGPCPR
jgi:hypothetical protein